MTPNVFNDVLLQLARAEATLLSSEFVAPVSRGGSVLVRLAGTWRSMMIVPPSFEGWGVFRPLTRAVAVCCREATASERTDYLSLFPYSQFIDPDELRGSMPARARELWFRAGDTEMQSLGICFSGEGRKLDTGWLGCSGSRDDRRMS